MRSGMVQFEEDLSPLMQDIDSVKQHGENYNNGDVETIVQSIHENGMYRPIIVDRASREIIAGNHTWQACKELQAEVIPVVFVDGNDTTQIKRMIADNRTAALARPDTEQLVELLSRLEAEHELSGTGYGEHDVEVLRQLNDIPLEPTGDFASWPTLFFQVPPTTKNAFYEMTDAAGGERERFELLMRLAGWDGKAPR